MRLSKLQFFAVLLTILLVSCTAEQKKREIIKQPLLKHKANRVAAEWEPAMGTIVVWPLDIPHKLVIELAKDARLYTMVPDEKEKQEAIKWYKKWNIDLNNVKFIISAQGLDSWWARDWGAFAVFDSVGNMHLADGQYEYSTPVTGMGCDEELQMLFTEKDEKTGEKKIILTTDDDETPADIAKHMGYKRVELPFTYTGGNVFMDGRGSAISTCIIKNENRYIGGNDEQLVTDAKKMLGIDMYNFISNFEHSGIQHIDCLLKMLDENRLFVMQPPVDHELYQVYEDIVNNELSKLKNAAGEPYEIIRLNTNRYDGEELAAYSNSLILNKNVYVPLFGIAQDSIALKQWSEALPGYNVKGFIYKVHEEPILHPRVLKRRASGFGWNSGDALHCRTRAMWDPQMLYIARGKNPVKTTDGYAIEANIIDYSNAGLVSSELKLFWRLSGDQKWNSVMITESGVDNYYIANVPFTESGKVVEYYFAAKSASGKAEFKPMTAPEGFYKFITE
jgi:agmatine/peptidylarginine deiminase